MTFDKYTTQGPRKINEDSLYVSKGEDVIYACVADGVGGMKHGEIASRYVTTKFAEYAKSSKNVPFGDFLTTTNVDLVEMAENDLGVSVGTTFTCAVISSDLIKGVHVGDSRVCILRGNGIKQLTLEHNEAGRLVREGKLDLANKKNYPRKNVIEHIMGSVELFKYQLFEFSLEKKDRIIISTDGFHDTLSKREIRDISLKYKSINEFSRQLTIEIENRILHDNTTFICVQI